MRNKAQLIVGDLNIHLVRALSEADVWYAVVAFLRTSGVDMLLEDLKTFIAAGGEIKVLTGDYLYITEPEALAALSDLGPNVEVRLWRSEGRSFHPKAYLFEAAAHTEVIVGSSNVTQSGLTTGVEWNLKVVDGEFQGVDPFESFLKLFYDEATVPANPVTIAVYGAERAAHSQPSIWQEMDRTEESGREAGVVAIADEELSPGASWNPLPPQQEALKALDASRQEGFNKGLVVLPTGLGKTYLAAFFARGFRRVLFVAHREEILQQAARTFRAVMPHKSWCRYDGHQRGPAGEMVFASVYTLAAKRHRERFDPEAFDLIVVDEFHHAAARSYQALMAYFRPQYLLGLTATPDRTDNKDVYALCDGHLVYQVTLSEAIARHWLVPFSYFGVLDPIDYAQVSWRGTHYDEWELSRAQMQGHYAKAVVNAWRRYHGHRTLLFCSSRAQSRYLAQQLSQEGVRARHVDGTTAPSQRREAVHDLTRGALDVLCSVDVFNEGLDIPLVDTIFLARPTDSPVVFLQQIGRGLRLAEGKTRCTIIDLVGNYRQVDRRLAALGIASLTAVKDFTRQEWPGDCRVELEFEVIDLLRRLRRGSARHRDQELLKLAYWALKSDLGRRPTYLEFHLQSGVDSTLVRRHYQSFVGFLEALGELTEEESRDWESAQGWLNEIERTLMQKSYKMVLLQVMLDRGRHWAEPIAAGDAARPFFDYLHGARYRRGDVDSQSALQNPFNLRRVALKIADMPMRYLAQSIPDYFALEGEVLTAIVPPGDRDRLAQWTREIVDYRLHRYFYERTAP